MRRRASFFLAGVTTLILLTGCAAAKKVTDNPDKIVDDGENNSVLLSYELVMDAVEKHSSVSTTSLRLYCEGKQTPCFRLKAGFAGRKQIDGFVTNRFQTEGAAVYQMEYGEYDLTSAKHSVIIDKWREQTCYNDKKGKRRCYYTTKEDDTDYSVSLPADARFFVAPGPGCYMGHMKINMSDNELVEFEFAADMNRVNDDMLAKLSPAIQGVVAERITVPCAR